MSVPGEEELFIKYIYHDAYFLVISRVNIYNNY